MINGEGERDAEVNGEEENNGDRYRDREVNRRGD
jgi:hypothetical protein